MRRRSTVGGALEMFSLPLPFVGVSSRRWALKRESYENHSARKRISRKDSFLFNPVPGLPQGVSHTPLRGGGVNTPQLSHNTPPGFRGQ